MKERWSLSKEKLMNLEEGRNGEDDKKFKKSESTCRQIVQYIKVILYLELTLFVGWACYSIWQIYHMENTNVVIFNITEPKSTILFSKSESEEYGRIPYDDIRDEGAILKVNEKDKITSVNEAETTTESVEGNDISSEIPVFVQDHSFILRSTDPLPTDIVSIDTVQKNSDSLNGIGNSDSLAHISREELLEWNFPFLWSINYGKERDEPSSSVEVTQSSSMEFNWLPSKNSDSLEPDELKLNMENNLDSNELQIMTDSSKSEDIIENYTSPTNINDEEAQPISLSESSNESQIILPSRVEDIIRAIRFYHPNLSPDDCTLKVTENGYEILQCNTEDESKTDIDSPANTDYDHYLQRLKEISLLQQALHSEDEGSSIKMDNVDSSLTAQGTISTEQFVTQPNDISSLAKSNIDFQSPLLWNIFFQNSDLNNGINAATFSEENQENMEESNEDTKAAFTDSQQEMATDDKIQVTDEEFHEALLKSIDIVLTKMLKDELGRTESDFETVLEDCVDQERGCELEINSNLDSLQTTFQDYVEDNNMEDLSYNDPMVDDFSDTKLIDRNTFSLFGNWFGEPSLINDDSGLREVSVESVTDQDESENVWDPWYSRKRRSLEESQFQGKKSTEESQLKEKLQNNILKKEKLLINRLVHSNGEVREILTINMRNFYKRMESFLKNMDTLHDRFIKPKEFQDDILSNKILIENIR